MYDENTATRRQQSSNNSTLRDADTKWQGCCRLALNLRRRDELQAFQAKLQEGFAVPQIDDPRLMFAAIALIGGMVAASVKRWDFLPPPSDAELTEPSAWAAQRLAVRRAEQDQAEQERRLRQRMARAFGETAGGHGIINPVHLQKSKHSLDELTKRLIWTQLQHQKKGREFTRELLDHRSPHYIRASDGGISNKQIVIMACEISGQREPRPFVNSWSIVVDYMNKQVKTE